MPELSSNKKSMELDANTYRQVEDLAAIGCTYDEIALILGITGYQLKKRRKSDVEFEERHQKGMARLKMSIRRMQLQSAMKGNVAMLIWLGKQYLQQTDRVEVDGHLQETFVLEVPSKAGDQDTWEQKWNPEMIAGGRP